MILHGPAADLHRDLLAGPAAHELASERRLRREHQHGLPGEFDLGSASAGTDEQPRAFPARGQFDIGTDVAGLAGDRRRATPPEGADPHAPGRAGRYHPGVAALYTALELPVVPVALNSGLFWGRRTLLIRPGTVTLEFLPALKPGMDRKVFLALLQERTETASERLRLEVQGEVAGATP